MAAWIAAARQASHLARLSSSKSAQAASLVHRCGLASGGDHHGPPKGNFWEEHFVIVFLTGLGLLFYDDLKFSTKGKDKKEEKVGKPPH